MILMPSSNLITIPEQFGKNKLWSALEAFIIQKFRPFLDALQSILLGEGAKQRYKA